MYPHQELTSETVKNYAIEWFEIAQAVGSLQFDRALREAVYASKFFPTVSDIRERAGMNQTKAAQSEGQQAWLLVLEYLRKYGIQRLPVCRGRNGEGELIMEHPPELPERVKHAVRIAGGLNAINETAPENLNFRRDDFVTAYENFNYVERFPLQLPEALRDLLPSAATPKALPPRKEAKAALEHITEVAHEENLARVRRKIEQVQIPEPAATPVKAYNFRGPLTESQCSDLKRRAEEVAKRYSQQGEQRK